jgi:hypothetical protein
MIKHNAVLSTSGMLRQSTPFDAPGLRQLGALASNTTDIGASWHFLPNGHVEFERRARICAPISFRQC